MHHKVKKVKDLIIKKTDETFDTWFNNFDSIFKNKYFLGFMYSMLIFTPMEILAVE